ncbi:MAG: Ig-like domain-containing protein [Candidatus Sulfotelmatobacter sp.]
MRHTTCPPARIAIVTLLALFAIPMAASADDGGQNPNVFPTQTFVRTRGNTPTGYTARFNVPGWVGAPFTMQVVNGNGIGRERVTSATVSLNGTQILGPSEINESVAELDPAVSPVAGENTLQVTVDGAPGAEISIAISGTNADHVPPQVTIVTPATGSYISTATPQIEITYSKAPGSDDDRHSGCDQTTLKVTIDGVDRTNLFTIRNGDATATIPARLALAPGLHTIVATLYNLARNQGAATSQFTVDLASPTIQIVQPALGVYLNSTTPTISIQYSDNDGVNLSSLKVLVNGADFTSLFQKTQTGATANIPTSSPLPQGANKIVAQIQDLAGNQANASTSFNIDTTPPVISFSQPTANSYLGASSTQVLVQYSDDQAIDTTKLSVTLDGVPLAMTASPTSATTLASGLGNGAHLLVASIKDLAGNVGSAQINFNVDTSVPTIHVTQPAPNAILNTHVPGVSISYSDVSGLNLTTLKVYVNGADATSLFTATSATATGQLTTAFSLPDGQNTITASIGNMAGTVGTASSIFLVDTTPPTISFQAPPSRTNSDAPAVTISYSDATSGVDPNTLVVTLDGANISTLVAPGASSATGVLQLNPPLADGTHVLTASVQDRAGNVSQPATLSFFVDTTPPVISFAAPLDNSFTNNPVPPLNLQYSDGTGTGINVSSVKVYLQQGTNPATDITSYFQVGSLQATGAIPSSASLADGTYIVSAVVNDLVGNAASGHATFVVDTVPPTGTIQAPAANAILNTAGVAVTLLYQDDRSGVDTSKLVLTVDGLNETAALTLGPIQATGTLPALQDGNHTIQLTVFDRSGNSSTVISQTFETDTTPPTIAASILPPPDAAGWNNTNVTVTFVCADALSGVATCPLPQIVTTEGANQIVSGTATDNAGNTTAGGVTLNIDKTPPTITAMASPPANGSGLYTSNETVTFICSDTLSGIAICPPPQLVPASAGNQVVSGTATDSAGNSATASLTLAFVPNNPPLITATATPSPNTTGWNNSPVTVTFSCSGGTGGIATCSAPVTVSTEGANQVVTGTAVDQSGHTATASANLNIDLSPPTVTPVLSPAPNAAGWNNSNLTVSFQCKDSLSGVATCPAAVPVSNEGLNTVQSQPATDLAGNSATSSLLVRLDKTPPTVAITSPSSGNVYSSQTLVSGSATDTASGVSGVTCNGAAAQLSGSGFTCNISLTTGADTISVTATDVAGNSASATSSVTLVPAPVVSITSPADLSFTNVTPITVRGTVDNPADTVTINGIAAFPSGGTFTATVPLVEGVNTLAVVATNAGGNQGTASVNVTLDTTPPHLTIDTPASNSITTSGTVSVTGIVNDIVPGTVNDSNAQVTVNGTAAQVANRTYSIAGVPLALGPNTIQAVARDQAGNATTTAITVTRVSPSQPPAPSIGQAAVVDSLTIISGNNQSATIAAQLASPLVVALTDPSGNPVANQTVIFKVTGNDGIVTAASGSSGAVTVNTDSNGHAQVSWTLGHRSGVGVNLVEASCAASFVVADFTAVGVAGSAAQIVVDSGENQTGVAGQALTFPLGVVVTDAGHNRIAGVPVTFTAVTGGGSFSGNPTQTITTDSDGRALAVLTLGPGADTAPVSNVVAANFPGNSSSAAAFTATALIAGDPTKTTISGDVLDNSNNPIPEVTMRLYQTNQGSNNNQPLQIGTPVQTDAQGHFVITSAPYGYFKLMADGTTAGGGSVSYPTLEYDIVTVAGQDNTVGTPIYLPVLDTVHQICVNATTGGTLTLPQYPGFSLTVAPGSATFPGGARQGCVTASTVHGDKVPMAPGFGQQPRFIVSIQPAGTLFNPPAAMTLPNVDGLAPRAKTEMYSYDHDLSMFVAIGTATVSDDGSVIASDPGVGVLKAGWHCGGDPNAAGSVADCGECQVCGGPALGCVPATDGGACGTAPQVEAFDLSYNNGSDSVHVKLSDSCASGNTCQQGACSPAPAGFDQQQIKDALDQALGKVFNDSPNACIESTLRNQIQTAVKNQDLYIDCNSQPGNSPDTCARAVNDGTNHVRLFPLLFHGCSESPAPVLLHELIHVAGDPGAPDGCYHNVMNNYQGPDCRDRAYGCMAACFLLSGPGEGNPAACDEPPNQLATTMDGCQPCQQETITCSDGSKEPATVCPTTH